MRVTNIIQIWKWAFFGEKKYFATNKKIIFSWPKTTGSHCERQSTAVERKSITNPHVQKFHSTNQKSEHHEFWGLLRIVLIISFLFLRNLNSNNQLPLFTNSNLVYQPLTNHVHWHPQDPIIDYGINFNQCYVLVCAFVACGPPETFNGRFEEQKILPTSKRKEGLWSLCEMISLFSFFHFQICTEI